MAGRLPLADQAAGRPLRAPYIAPWPGAPATVRPNVADPPVLSFPWSSSPRTACELHTGPRLAERRLSASSTPIPVASTSGGEAASTPRGRVHLEFRTVAFSGIGASCKRTSDSRSPDASRVGRGRYGERGCQPRSPLCFNTQTSVPRAISRALTAPEPIWAFPRGAEQPRPSRRRGSSWRGGHCAADAISRRATECLLDTS
jgi:hypothetical protein